MFDNYGNEINNTSIKPEPETGCNYGNNNNPLALACYDRRDLFDWYLHLFYFI